ncbi:MAG: arylesterase [Proteobacteria bacterium]|nr:arylesterase [Pseudomonadota bacterium]MBU1708638.1 arylesterase [Pseudomonadota bacterium]
MKKTIIFLILIGVAISGYRAFFSGWEIKNVEPVGDTIICFGDSLTFGTGAAKGLDYPSQLAQLLGREVVNAGIPGDTTETALARLEQDVLSKSPGVVLITLGGNDLLQGVAKDTAFARLKTIIETIQNQRVLVVVGGIRFAFLDRGYADGYEKLCKETGAVFIPDILGGIKNKPELMSDRIHPNAAGYTKVAQRFYDSINKYI